MSEDRQARQWAFDIDRHHLVSNAKYGSAQESIDKEYEYQSRLLTEAYAKATAIVAARSSCPHDYNAASFTVRRNVLNQYLSHYERTCKICSSIETYVQREADEIPPEWTKGARQRYYNNDL